MAGRIINSPAGMVPGPPVYSSEGCWYPTWVKAGPWRVKGSDRIVYLTQHLGRDRYLCTDHKGKCHPCYNLDTDLEPATGAKP